MLNKKSKWSVNKIDKQIRLIELFAGVGAQAKALKNLGVDFVYHKVIEFDKYAIASYNAIHGTSFQTTDIRDVKGSDLDITECDKYLYILTYSFPCTDISNCGLQMGMSKGSSTRSGLLWEVERLLNETENLPQVLLMENVPAVHNPKNIKDFEQWLLFLKEKGYVTFYEDLDARGFGIPQSRKRCFAVSFLDNKSFTFPKPSPLTVSMADILEPEPVAEKFYLKNDKTEKLLTDLEAKGELP